ncbi:MAG: tRNA (adenine-N1)-methyltransferase [Chloroflexi bacterium]|nr:tRNA (adenine-N1)-methyltransferase [Chloroflexota bacterium]
MMNDTMALTEDRSLLRDGEVVLLVDNGEHRYMMVLGRGRSFQSHQGMLRHEAIIGQPEGVVLATNTGYPLAVLRPSLSEFVMKLKRHTQIIYPKDLALILVMADLKPGLRVVESGIGSGALSVTVLRALAGQGELISYEIREEHATKALKNIAMLCPDAAHHTVKVQDIYQTGIEDRNVDRILLDLPEPWMVIPSAAEAMQPGGILFVYLPTVLQVHRVMEMLRADPQWAMLEVLESLVRPWHSQDMSIRPEHRMVAHSGFLIFARRLAAPLPYAAPRKKKKPTAGVIAGPVAVVEQDTDEDDGVGEEASVE